MRTARVLAAFIAVLLSACDRGPDAARLEADIQARLDQTFGADALDLAWLRRSGSAPGASPREAVVYVDLEIAVRPGYDFTAWDSPGLGALADLLGATADGVRAVSARDAERAARLQVHGSMGYRLEDGGWVESRPAPVELAETPDFDNTASPSEALGLLDRIGAILAEAERDATGPAGQIVTAELETALVSIERRLARARSVYGFASGTPGAEYWRLGQAYARFAADRGLRVANLASAGSVENIRLLRNGEADLGLVQSDIAELAFGGRDIFEREGPMVELRALASLYPELVHVIARSDAGIARVADLAGRRVDLGPFGSGSRRNALAVLASHGLATEDLERIGQSAPAEALQALRRGEVDAVFMTIGVQARLLRTFFARNAAHLVPLDPEAAAAIAEATPGLVALSIPAFSYARQPAALPTIASTALLATTSRMPDGEAAAILGWTFEEMDFLALGSLQGTRISSATAKAGVAIPLHDGADAYFERRGARGQGPEAPAPEDPAP